MEDISTFLLLIGAIAIGFIQYARKEAKKNAEKESNAPTLGDAPSFDRESPLPESWGGNTYGGYIPEGPAPVKTASTSQAHKPEKRKKTGKKAEAFIPEYLSDSPMYGGTIKPSQQSTLPPIQELDTPDEIGEFAIHSIDEARRAFVWSEILQRKY